jgi:ABC-type transport system substrate-binding protein
MDQAIQTIDDEKAAVIYKEIQEILYEDKATFPLYYEPHMVGVRKGIEGYAPRLDEYVIVRDASFTKQ